MNEETKDSVVLDYSQNYQSVIELMLSSVDESDIFLSIQLIVDHPMILENIEYKMLKKYVRLLFNFYRTYRASSPSTILGTSYVSYRPYASHYYYLTSSVFEEGRKFHKLHARQKVMLLCKYVHETERKTLPV